MCRGEEYFEIVDEFLDAVRHKFPNAFVQFEDFSSEVAYDILKYYRCEADMTRSPVCVFNDDIQGECCRHPNATPRACTNSRRA